MRMLFAIALLPGLVLAQGNPLPVAPEGCRFEWRGAAGYTETAYSHGPGPFPTILFSRKDVGPQTLEFIPFCGEICQNSRLIEGYRNLLNLTPGTTLDIDGTWAKLTIRVEGPGVVPETGLPAVRVLSMSGEITLSESWWSTELGWLVGYRDARVHKWVVDWECPKVPSV